MELTAPVAGEARVDLFDVSGRRVASATPRIGAAGTLRLTLGHGMPPGLYLARATMAGQSVGARVAVIR